MPRTVNRLPATLLCLALPLATASAQSCADQTRSHPSKYTVSASDLRIPPRAWQRFEKARAASERNDAGAFARESAAALSAYPRFAEVYLLRATREIHAGQSEAAIQTIATARAIQPDVPWSGVILAGALTQLRRYHDAIAALSALRGDEAGSWQAAFERTRAEIGVGDVAAALAWSERTLAAAPAGCAEVRLLRANAFQLARRPRDAVAELEAYLTLDPGGAYHIRAEAALAGTRQALEELRAGSLLASHESQSQVAASR